MRRAWTTYPRAGAVLVALLALAASLLVTNWPLITAPEARLPGDLGDVRFIHYLLEHGWRWVSGDPQHPLWSPPFYYPVEGTGAYSDLMIGHGILYWPWRLVGIGMMTSLSLWIVACHVLNFAGAWLLLRCLLGFSPLATAAGATLFTTGSPRLNQLNHLQFLPQFFVLMSLAGVIMLFKDSGEASELAGAMTGIARTRRQVPRPWIAIALLFGGLVLQLYSAFYYGWFLIFALAIAATWMLVIPALRRDLVAMLRRNARPLGVGVVMAIVALIPWARHYLAAASLNPTETFESIQDWVPRYQSWLYVGRASWLYGDLMKSAWFDAIPGWSNHEHRLGIGFVTLLVAGAGLLGRIREKWIALTVLVSLTLLLLSTKLPGDIWLWRYVFDWVPGAPAMRTVTRISLMLLLPASLGVAIAVEWLLRHRQVVIPVALIGLVLLEQGNDYSTWRQAMGPPRAEAIASEIPAGCASFFYSPEAAGPNMPEYPAWMYQIDAMWAGLYAGVPTVNAYGHNVPPGWDLEDPAIRIPKDADRIAAALAEWEARHPGAAPICHVRIPVV